MKARRLLSLLGLLLVIGGSITVYTANEKRGANFVGDCSAQADCPSPQDVYPQTIVVRHPVPMGLGATAIAAGMTLLIAAGPLASRRATSENSPRTVGG